MAKEIGKLTAAQFLELVQALPDLFAKMREMAEHLASVPVAKFDTVMADEYGSYCHVYEMPLDWHLATLVVAMNRQGELHAMASAFDPQGAVLELIRRRNEEEDDHPRHEAFSDAAVIALSYSMLRTMQSLATYGRSISSLLQDVRDNKNQDSLFKAIRMDRAVLGCPTVMKHIARAQLRDNKVFFRKLRSALGGPDKKQQAGLDLMRYAMVLLREMEVKDISEAELESLMVEKLGVYPKNQPSARKNLRAHYQRAMKLPTI